LICGDQATRTDDVDGDDGGTEDANDVAAHTQVWLAAAGVSQPWQLRLKKRCCVS
jgi:hypothetical protein